MAPNIILLPNATFFLLGSKAYGLENTTVGGTPLAQ
jgi:hypothetical protein